jgi:hypothetical protein
MRTASIICFAVALIVCAWFGLGVRQAINTSRAAAIANQGNHLTAAQERKVTSLVGDARLLNPDKEPDILIGQAEVEHGDFARARRLLDGVTRSEPQNLEGWLWLAHSAAGDPALLYTAVLHVRRLEPHSPLQ